MTPPETILKTTLKEVRDTKDNVQNHTTRDNFQGNTK